MKPNEKGVLKKSNLYFSTPSTLAKKTYFYPLSAGHFFAVKNYHLVRDNYDSLLITHIIDGSFTFVLEGKHITAHKGDTVFLDCFVPHEYYTNDSFESIWVHFAGSNCRKMYEEIIKIHGNLFQYSDSEHIKKLLFRIFYSISGENPVPEFNLSLDIYKLFADLLNETHISSKNNASYEDTIQDIKLYIMQHINENLSVDTLAKVSNMSASHFSRVFKQQTGFSPYDYVLTSRLNKAKEYLQKTDLSMLEIAYNIGFNSEANFSYFFTTNVGISPTKFRKLRF